MKKPDKTIPITGPSITDLEVNYAEEAAREGWFENHSKYINEFQKKFADYIGVDYAIATSSCHGALHLALASLGIGEGDEVIVPDITWIASASTVTYVDATPVFVDVEPDTWCIDPESVEEAITEDTKAIMPVTIYGHPPEMDEILDIAERHDLYVLEDAAESVGSKYKDKRPGSMGDCGAFSFHGTKIMTTGEGGMFVTDDKDLYERAHLLSNQGKDPDKLYWNLEIGLKYKMSNMQAAIGLAQLERIDELAEKKRQIFRWYKDRLGDIEGLQMNIERDCCFNTYWMTTVIWDESFDINKREVMDKMSDYNIMTRPIFYPLSDMPPFEDSDADTPVAHRLSPSGINLPCGHDITEKEVDYVCRAFRKVLGV